MSLTNKVIEFYNALPEELSIPEKVRNRSFRIAKLLEGSKFEIFATLNNSVQFEINFNGDYLEIEVGEDGEHIMFLTKEQLDQGKQKNRVSPIFFKCLNDENIVYDDKAIYKNSTSMGQDDYTIYEYVGPEEEGKHYMLHEQLHIALHKLEKKIQSNEDTRDLQESIIRDIVSYIEGVEHG